MKSHQLSSICQTTASGEVDSIYQRYGKRAFDFVVASLAALVLLPLLVATAIIVRVSLGSPVLFAQQRPGRHGRLFCIHKFRTMTDRRDENGSLLPDADRLTPVGRFLRASSLDELPELWDVIVGRLSLVGPRPLLPEYLPLYSGEQGRRHEVRPGITGWAQVNGRNRVGWEERLQMDVWYVDHFSFWLDIRILLKTLVTVFTRAGVSADGHSTMPVFQGKPSGKRLIVLGAGGHGRVLLSTLLDAGFHVDAIYDDNPALWGKDVFGVRVLGPLQDLSTAMDCRAVIGVGDNATRQRLADKLKLEWITVVHPKAYVHESVILGPGTVVFAGAVVQPGVTVGRHALINTAASVDHDCNVGDFVSLGPGVRLAGAVVVGNQSELGTASCVIPAVTIGRNVVVGAGAVVIRDVKYPCTIVGSPARVVSKTESVDVRAA